MSETSDVTRPLLDAISNVPGCVGRRQHAGWARGLKGGRVYLGEEGWPDIIVLVRGVTLLIETKVPGGKLRPSQVKMHARLRAAGFEVHTIDNVPDGLEIVRAALNRRQT